MYGDEPGHRRARRLRDVQGEIARQGEKIQVGDGMNAETWLGPCASEKQYETVLDYIRKGKEEGAKLLSAASAGRSGAGGRLFTCSPAVFDRVMPTWRIAREEIFGPVLALIRGA